MVYARVVCGKAHPCAHVSGAQADAEWCFLSPPPPRELSGWPDWLSIEFLGSSYLCLPWARIRGTRWHTQIFTQVLGIPCGMNSGPHASIANSYPRAISPAPKHAALLSVFGVSQLSTYGTNTEAIGTYFLAPGPSFGEGTRVPFVCQCLTLSAEKKAGQSHHHPDEGTSEGPQELLSGSQTLKAMLEKRLTVLAKE